MSNSVWTEDKECTVEAHHLTGMLFYKNKLLWGPKTCHARMRQLGNALYDLDDGFHMKFHDKEKSIETHTRYISVKVEGKVILDKFSTHENADELATVVNDVLADPGKFEQT